LINRDFTKAECVKGFPATVLDPANMLLDRVAISFLHSKNLIQQFLRLKVKCSLLIYGNAQEA